MNIRRLVAGFLAGASSVIGILAILMLVLLGAGIAELVRDLTLPNHANTPFSQAFGQAIGNSLAALPGYFWSTRWAMVALALLGLLLAVVDAQRRHITRAWRDDLGFVVTIGVVGGVIIWLLFASRATVQGWIADQPALFTQQQLLLGSNTALLVIGALVTFGLAYTIWATWGWWFEHWTRWLRIPRTAASATTPSAPEAAAPRDIYDFRTSQARLLRAVPDDDPPNAQMARVYARAAKSPVSVLIGSLIVLTIAAFALLAAYNAVGPGLLSGELWVTRETPHVAAPITFGRLPKQMSVSNTGGNGAVDVTVTAGSNATPLRPATPLKMTGDPNSFESSKIDLQGLPAGDYRLELLLRGGTGGLLRYVGLYGGGLEGEVVGAAIGLAAGLWLALATVLVLELVVRGGPLEATA